MKLPTPQYYVSVLVVGLLFLVDLACTKPKKTINEDSLRDSLTKEISDYYNQKNNAPNAKKTRLSELEPALIRLNDITLLAKAWILMSEIYLDQSQPDSSALYLAKIKSHLNEIDNQQLVNQYCSVKGRYLSVVQMPDSALYYFEQSLRIAENTDNKGILASSYNNIGIIHNSRSRMQSAHDYYIKALQVFDELNDSASKAAVLNNIGDVVRRQNEYEKAEDYFLQAIELNTLLNNKYNLSMNYGNLGITYEAMKRYDKAIEAHQKSLEIAINEHILLDQTRAFHNIGTIYYFQGKYRESEDFLKQSYAMCRQYKLLYGLMLNHLSLAQLYDKQEKLHLAMLHADSSLSLAKETQDTEIEVEAYKLMWQIKEKQGDIDQSFAYLKLFTEKNDTLIKITNRAHILDIQEKYHTEKKSMENSLLKQENQSKTQTIRYQRVVTLVISIMLAGGLAFVAMLVRSRRKIRINADILARLNQEKEVQNQQLQDLNTTKDLLFSIIGHDLRSPFNSLLGFLQVFIDEYDEMDPEKRSEILQSLYSHSNNTFTMLENLLQWAMSQRGQIKFNPVMVDLYQVIETELNFLQSRLDFKQIKAFNGTVEQTFFKGDEDMLRTIFRNLINNAIKFSHPGGTISIVQQNRAEGILISVVDTGVGMTAETIERLTGNQEIISTKGTNKEKGSGLGLLIVKDLLKYHRGRLSIISEPDKGSRFSVFLPY